MMIIDRNTYQNKVVNTIDQFKKYNTYIPDSIHVIVQLLLESYSDKHIVDSNEYPHDRTILQYNNHFNTRFTFSCFCTVQIAAIPEIIWIAKTTDTETNTSTMLRWFSVV